MTKRRRRMSPNEIGRREREAVRAVLRAEAWAVTPQFVPFSAMWEPERPGAHGLDLMAAGETKQQTGKRRGTA